MQERATPPRCGLVQLPAGRLHLPGTGHLATGWPVEGVKWSGHRIKGSGCLNQIHSVPFATVQASWLLRSVRDPVFDSGSVVSVMSRVLLLEWSDFSLKPMEP